MYYIIIYNIYYIIISQLFFISPTQRYIIYINTMYIYMYKELEGGTATSIFLNVNRHFQNQFNGSTSYFFLIDQKITLFSNVVYTKNLIYFN